MLNLFFFLDVKYYLHGRVIDFVTFRETTYHAIDLETKNMTVESNQL